MQSQQKGDSDVHPQPVAVPVALQPGAPQGYPPVQPGAPGYHAQPGAPGSPAGAQNVPQQPQVAWMPPPAEVPPDCPPGLEYLTQIDQLLVQQQIELLEVVTAIEIENKYRICNSLGQQVYFATEKSSFFQRQNYGAARAFSMAITDNTQREVIHLERPFWCCFSCCQPSTIEVQAPPGTVVGFVRQNRCSLVAKFRIENAEGETVLNIAGPCCNCSYDVNFEVLSADGQQNVGRISKQWSGLAQEYFTNADNFGIQFPMDLDVKMKAVMLGACFLIDFMFFEERPDQRH